MSNPNVTLNSWVVVKSIRELRYIREARLDGLLCESGRIIADGDYCHVSEDCVDYVRRLLAGESIRSVTELAAKVLGWDSLGKLWEVAWAYEFATGIVVDFQAAKKEVEEACQIDDANYRLSVYADYQRFRSQCC